MKRPSSSPCASGRSCWRSGGAASGRASARQRMRKMRRNTRDDEEKKMSWPRRSGRAGRSAPRRASTWWASRRARPPPRPRRRCAWRAPAGRATAAPRRPSSGPGTPSRWPPARAARARAAPASGRRCWRAAAARGRPPSRRPARPRAARAVPAAGAAAASSPRAASFLRDHRAKADGPKAQQLLARAWSLGRQARYTPSAVSATVDGPERKTPRRRVACTAAKSPGHRPAQTKYSSWPKVCEWTRELAPGPTELPAGA